MSKPTLLIAEDSDTLRPLIVTALQNTYKIRDANSGKAVTAIIEEGCCFDCCIMDIIMPSESDDEDETTNPDETGLRMLSQLADLQLCSRFVILSVRWDINEKVKSRLLDKANWVILRKQDAELEVIQNALQKVLQQEGLIGELK